MIRIWKPPAVASVGLPGPVQFGMTRRNAGGKVSQEPASVDDSIRMPREIKVFNQGT